MTDFLTSPFLMKKCESVADKERCFRLRYAVFVEELGFEPPSSLGFEIDDYDAMADHYLIVDNINNVDIGCLRILPSLSNYVCEAPYLDSGKSPNETKISLEVSRLVILKPYRAKGVILKVVDDVNNILLSRDQDAYAVVERWLGYLIARARYNASQASDEFELRGRRCVFLLQRTIRSVAA